MNLGDGLLFELENGKPKLIFNNQGFESKTSSRISKNPPRNRPPRLVPALKQVPPQPPHVRPQRTPAKGPTTCKNPSDTTAAPDTQAAHCLRKTKAKRVDRVQSANRSDSHAAKTASEITRSPKKNLKENLVCLTQDQLQQILSSINQTACLGETQKVTEDPRDDEVISRQTDEALVSEGNIRRNGSAQDKGKDDKKVVNGAVAGFFSRLGERELEKEALEAKRAQWRRELDEQLVEKQQQRGGAEAVVRGAPWRLSATSSCRGSQLRLQEESCAASSMGDAEGRGSTFSSQRDLPAAIRSAFVLGEASPSDEAFSADRKEQQRLWLQELERQREEAHQRRRQEKLLHSQAEDHDRWTMHFDSLHKSVPPQPPAGVCSSLPPPRSPSGAQSSGWEAASVCGGDGQGRISADTPAGGNPPKASHLRTMTALLDPAQLEERERKRLKQLEHQRAINTQVEERRRQKEQERLEQKRQEQEEEKRVAKEREHLQQQYLLDMQRERHKEKLLSRRTEEMLLSVQRAQEEAQKDKQLQRIRDLARKGHDVSKLLGSLERRSTDLVPGRPLRDSDLSLSAESQSPAGSLSAALRIEELSPVSPRRDTGVQTVDMDGGILDAKRVSDPPVLDKATVPRPTPPCPRKPGREAQQQQQSSGKENVWNSAAEPPGGPGQSDPYERFRRTAHRPRPGDGKRPEWNTRRPSRPFVPASERYPAGTRVHRQESRLRRQMELLTLVERNTNCRSAAPPLEPVASASPQTQDEYSDHPTAYTVVVHADSRGRSSPISALGLNQQPQHHRSSPQQNSEGFSDAPPASDFVPYVRTDDVYHLDPLAVPHTQEPPRKQQTGVGGSRQSRPNAVRDPLLHPELLKTSERQQAILKGLSELRQGLLQKQRELETSLNPLLQGQGSNMAAPF